MPSADLRWKWWETKGWRGSVSREFRAWIWNAGRIKGFDKREMGLSKAEWKRLGVLGLDLADFFCPAPGQRGLRCRTLTNSRTAAEGIIKDSLWNPLRSDAPSTAWRKLYPWMKCLIIMLQSLWTGSWKVFLSSRSDWKFRFSTAWWWFQGPEASLRPLPIQTGTGTPDELVSDRLGRKTIKPFGYKTKTSRRWSRKHETNFRLERERNG